LAVLCGPVTEMRPEPASYPQGKFEVPPGGLDLILVRHGQSEAFVEGEKFALVDGHGDPPLSELGRAQAERVGERLATAGIEAIYVTTLQRTAQTAAPLAARTGLPVRVEPDLREVLLGEWEGGTFRKNVAEGHPIALRMFAQERWDVIPGGKSSEAFEARVRAGIERIAANHAGQRVVVVTHGGVVGRAVKIASGSRPFAFNRSDNASISTFAVLGDDWSVRSFNDTAHLNGLL
jgi:2,3-bisphosphoglycerate-dependent phosphoglycerate mutase